MEFEQHEDEDYAYPNPQEWAALLQKEPRFPPEYPVHCRQWSQMSYIFKKIINDAEDNIGSRRHNGLLTAEGTPEGMNIFMLRALIIISQNARNDIFRRTGIPVEEDHNDEAARIYPIA